MKATNFAFAALALLALLAPSVARADTVAGKFDISGNVTLTSTTINWGDTATIGSAPTGIYSALGNTSISIANLNTATEPVLTPFTAQPFIGFTADPSLSSLLINFVFAGIDGAAQCANPVPAAGQICTPNSPTSYLQATNFMNTSPSTSSLSWDFSGVSADGTETWLAIFTAQTTDPYQAILADIASGGSLITTYSATIQVFGNPTSTAPEPSTIALLGAGLLGLVGAARRKRRT